MSKHEFVQNKFKEIDGYCFTMDVDWASDIVIENAVRFFCDYNIPLTIFSTHKSSFLDKLILNQNIDIGIHPNFIQPSSQGENINEIIQNLLSLVPNAESFRCHRWYSSNDIYEKMVDKGLKYESNICSLFENVLPFRHRSGLISFPVFFEDGAYLYHNMGMDFYSNKDVFMGTGLKIIDFHPMHFALNTPYFQYMRDIKDNISRCDWNQFGQIEIKKMKYHGTGIGEFMKNLVEYVQLNKYRTFTLKDLYKISIS